MANKLWLSQEISSDPDLPNIKRTIHVRSAALQADYEQIVIYAYITYKDKDGNDVTSKFRSDVGDWIINNNTFTSVLSESGEPVSNPDYVDAETTPDIYPYQRKPSYDYFHEMVTVHRADLIGLLEKYIAYDDSNGDFNF